ncbi:MAG: ATP-dependent helicase [Burkholderiaceae bacterium]|nr:ATP-dependent helicase [Burkholderiaceae bacterium]
MSSESAPAQDAKARWLDGLNSEQVAAAAWGERDASGAFRSRPLLVIAGAGSGKTATIAHRVAHLVLNGVDPVRILLLTFSRRAANEMTRRAERLVADALAEARREIASRALAGAPAAVRLPWAGTFHAIGARLLRSYATRLGLEPNFGVLDRGDAADLIDLARHELGYSATKKRFPRKDTCLAIYSHRVNTGWPLEQVLARVFPWCADWEQPLRALFREYVRRKQGNGVLDYDDLLLWWDAALQDEAIAREVGARFDHVLVDEYQDTNLLQARILQRLRPDGSGLMVVGDDAQSIYAFRGADVENILGFAERFDPAAHRVALELNYRSVQPVLDAANALISEGARQYPKRLRAHRAGGERPRLVTVLDDRAQADWVIGEILRRREEGVVLKKQAVLFRSSHHSDLLEVELTRRNIPYVKHGGLRFLEAAHVKDLLAVLRWADNPRNSVAAFRVLQMMRGMGPANAQRCLDLVVAAQAGNDAGKDATKETARAEAAKAASAPSGTVANSASRPIDALARFVPPAPARDEWPEFVAMISALADPDAAWTGQVARVRQWYMPVLARRFDDSGVRAADLEMLEAIAAQFGTRERFLTELALDPPRAGGDLAGDPLLDEDYLILSTVHSAKGQEWDAVYLINVADGNFPNEYATGDAAAIEEERRLLYVAMTRARDALQLIEPQRYYVTHQRKLGGDYVHGSRSRFLTAAVLARLDRAGPQPDADANAATGQSNAPTSEPAIDVKKRLRGMW